MSFEQGLILSILIGTFAYGFFCQEMARKHISREKVHALQDMSIVSNGRLPPEQILDEQGIKYRRQCIFAMVLWIAEILTIVVVKEFSG